MKKCFLVIACIIIPILLSAQTEPKDWKKKKFFPFINKTHTKIPKNERKKPFQDPKRKTVFMYPEWSFDSGIGTTNSFTDIGGRRWEGRDLFTDVQFRSTNLNLAFSIEYRHQTRMGYCIAFNYGKISGSDAYSPNTSRSGRNHSFTNKIYELGLKHKFYLLNNIYRSGWTNREPFQYYIYYGVNGFLNNPKLIDPSGDNITKPYSKLQVSVPIGLGLHYTFEKHLRVGFDIAYRTTFTDYLDGFTTKWSDRRDAYMFSSFNVGYVLSKNTYKKRSYDNKKFKLKLF